MDESILKTIKKLLGLDAEYDAFDLDVILHINSVFAELHSIGVGPEDGFAIEDDSSKWQDFLENRKDLNNVKTLIYLKVRILFDPPGTSFAINAMEKMAEEAQWRIHVTGDESLVYHDGP